MAEEAPLKRCKQLKGCTAQRANESADRISQLPDTTLTQILSLLDLKEAGRCDVLSCRWKGLWKWTTRLDFDASEELIQIIAARTVEDISRREISRSNYVTWVNQVLTLHESRTLDEFRVHFNLNARARKDIDRWIKVAISKMVKKLDIDLKSYSGKKKYVISPEFCDYLKSPANLSNVKHLTSLSLNDVDINGELVEYFLSSCSHLEKLDVSFSNHIVDLKVVGPSLPLKHLRLHACHSLESIELSAPNLASFTYFGRPAIFKIGNNPLLKELSIGSLRNPIVAHALVAFSKLLSQLETLKFFICQVERIISPVGKFMNLRQLTLKVMASPTSMLDLSGLIFAVPSLEKCTLELIALIPRMGERRAAKRLTQPHQCLKYVGSMWVT